MRQCHTCGKKDIKKNTVALNKKILGRKIEAIQCLECLSEYLEVTEEELLDKIEEFKNDGCKLFA